MYMVSTIRNMISLPIRTFKKTGLASAAWHGKDLEGLKLKLKKEKCRILGDIGLPIRGNSEPNALVFQGLVGEILELIV